MKPFLWYWIFDNQKGYSLTNLILLLSTASNASFSVKATCWNSQEKSHSQKRRPKCIVFYYYFICLIYGILGEENEGQKEDLEFPSFDLSTIVGEQTPGKRMGVPILCRQMSINQSPTCPAFWWLISTWVHEQVIFFDFTKCGVIKS